MNQMLYLASQSPRRKTLLKRLGRSFRVVRSTHRETIRRDHKPSANAMRNACGKARKAILPKGATGTVIGADTFLYFRGRVIGKPKTMRSAMRLLEELSGCSHWVYTGLCLLDIVSGEQRLSFDKTKVTFKRVSRETIGALFEDSSPLDKAGGYSVQEERGRLIAGMQGSQTNVIGLPMELLRRELVKTR